MCGICGAIGMESQDTGAAVVRRMMEALRHRGPDEDGFLSVPGCAVGMRRLSIIDLDGGRQPVWNEARTLAAVFNGEIYNFQELREELQALGHRFATRSDTEVIVHAYESWGEDCVRRFHGMFAFALVNMPRGASAGTDDIFLARDPLGIKPLYYTVVDRTLLFASEVRALLASACLAPRLSPEAISSYLLFGSVSEPLSMLDGVFSLPPGHFLRISASRPDSRQEPQSYWPGGKFQDAPRSNGSAQPHAIAAEIRVLLERAVASHLIADVPVGVFLSSGLDSTAIATLASRAQPGIHTFTVAFPDLEFSEAETARRTAKSLGTEHRELTLSSEEMLRRTGEAIAGFDQPSMDGINTYFVSWAARQAGLKVALSGLGSDELFGGYSTFDNAPALRRVAGGARFFPRSVRKLAANALAAFKPGGRSPDGMSKALAAFRQSAALPDEYFFARLLFTPERIERSGAGVDAPSWPSTRWWQWLSSSVQQARSLDAFTWVSWLELRSYLASTLLRDTDAMSMNHSLEVRVPFLDLPLVDYTLSLSAAHKLSRGRPKSLLVNALRDVLPPEVIAQRKRTFTFPWHNWLRTTLRECLGEGLADWAPALEPHISRQFALDVWENFLAGRTSWSRPWSLFVLNEWVKQHVSPGKPEIAARYTPAAARVL